MGYFLQCSMTWPGIWLRLFELRFFLVQDVSMGTIGMVMVGRCMQSSPFNSEKKWSVISKHRPCSREGWTINLNTWPLLWVLVWKRTQHHQDLHVFRISTTASNFRNVKLVYRLQSVNIAISPIISRTHKDLLVRYIYQTSFGDHPTPCIVGFRPKRMVP